MPFFRDIKTLKQQAREIDRLFDPGSQMRAARERTAQAPDVLARPRGQVPSLRGRNQVY